MRRGLRKYEGLTLIVHGAGPSIRGVLLKKHRDCLVVAHARHLDTEADLAGEVLIPLTPGVWLQHAPTPPVSA